MEKGFKTLRGVRVMLSIPKKEESVIKLDSETQKELDRKFVETFKSLEVYAVGDAADPLFKQAITAAGDGARAALGVTSYLFQSGAVLPSSSEVSKESADAKVEKAVAAIAVETQAETLSKAEQFPGSTIEITSFDQFSKEVTTSSIPVLIDFYASWCGPCRHISPKIEKYAATLQGKCKIVKVNVQHVAEIADLYSIRSMPTLVSVNRDGKEIERRSGVSEILAFLESFK